MTLPPTEHAATDVPPSRVAHTLSVRDALAGTWGLFQVSWLSCLPLALLAVCATGAPGAESITSGEGRGLDHSARWWSLYVASGLLTLACYGAVLLRQLALATGTPLNAFEAFRRSMLSLPASVACAVLTTGAVGIGLALLVVPGLALIVLLAFVWIAVLWEHKDPIAAWRRSVQLVRGRFRAIAAIIAAALAAVLVFVLLAGIFFGVVMAIAGSGVTATSLALSRVLFAAVLSLPVIYLSAMIVTVYQSLVRTDVPATT